MIKHNFSRLAEAFDSNQVSEEDVNNFIHWVSSIKNSPDKQEDCLHANSKAFLKNFTKSDTPNTLDVIWSEDKRKNIGNCLEGCPKEGRSKRCQFNRLVIDKKFQYNDEVESFFGKIENEFIRLQKNGWDAFCNPSIYMALVSISFLCINFYRSQGAMEKIYYKRHSDNISQIDYFREALRKSLFSLERKTVLFFRTFDTPLLLAKEHVLVNKHKIPKIGGVTNFIQSDFIYAPLSRYTGCIIYKHSFKNEKFIDVSHAQLGGLLLPDYQVDLDFVAENIVKQNRYSVFPKGHYLTEQLAISLNILSVKNTLFSEYYGYNIHNMERLNEIWLNRRKIYFRPISL